MAHLRSETVAIHAELDALCAGVHERRAPGLLRLSVGCERVEDLCDDLEQAP